MHHVTQGLAPLRARIRVGEDRDVPEHVAILGGGPAGIAAAFDLTEPELEGRYEVTVLQSGWRLGGKCASGRNAGASDRIEEHGLHIWFGFYENAFGLMRRCFQHTGGTLESSFEPCDHVALFDRRDEDWRLRSWTFPTNAGTPGDPCGTTMQEIGERTFAWVRDALDGHDGDLPPGAEPLIGVFVGIFEAVIADDDEVGVSVDDAIAAMLKLSRRMRGFLAGAGETLRQYAMAFDLMTTIFRGILDDELVRDGFAKINDEELSAWLARHGAEPETLDGPILRAFYQLCFAYRDGNRDQRCLAAGKAVQALLRMVFTYQGSVMWKMRDGMGDAIFAPLYAVLRDRGVRFSFFHHVQHLHLDDTRNAVRAIDVVRQAELAQDGPYSPLVDGRWPSAPRWERLAGGAALRSAGIDFERGEAVSGAPTERLERGRDFDHVVLAIPVGALEPICTELSAHDERFARMLRDAATVRTQALQLWMDADAAQLGWEHPDTTISGAYVEPLDTCCNMSHLIAHEGWPTGSVRHIAYFCGVMSEDGTDEEAQQRAADDADAHVTTHMRRQWPNIDGAAERARYTRANVSGSERYVLTPPGAVTSRLRPSESGFENLVLAGDWTRNGICGGSVEAAVTSGRLAAQAISGAPGEISGVSGWLVDD